MTGLNNNIVVIDIEEVEEEAKKSSSTGEEIKAEAGPITDMEEGKPINMAEEREKDCNPITDMEDGKPTTEIEGANPITDMEEDKTITEMEEGKPITNMETDDEDVPGHGGLIGLCIGSHINFLGEITAVSVVGFGGKTDYIVGEPIHQEFVHFHSRPFEGQIKTFFLGHPELNRMIRNSRLQFVLNPRLYYILENELPGNNFILFSDVSGIEPDEFVNASPSFEHNFCFQDQVERVATALTNNFMTSDVFGPVMNRVKGVSI